MTIKTLASSGLNGDLQKNDRNFLNGDLSVASLKEAQYGMVELNGFTYTVQSEADATASSTFIVTVRPVNDPSTIKQTWQLQAFSFLPLLIQCFANGHSKIGHVYRFQ